MLPFYILLAAAGWLALDFEADQALFRFNVAPSIFLPVMFGAIYRTSFCGLREHRLLLWRSICLRDVCWALPSIESRGAHVPESWLSQPI